MRKNEVSERPVRPRSKTAQLSSLLNELSVLRREHSRQRTLPVHAKEALVECKDLVCALSSTLAHAPKGIDDPTYVRWIKEDVNPVLAQVERARQSMKG